MAFSSQLSLPPSGLFLWILKVFVYLFSTHSCSLPPGVPTLPSAPAHTMLLLHAPVDTDGQTQLPTSVYLATLLFPFLHMSRSVYVSSLGAEQTGFLVIPLAALLGRCLQHPHFLCSPQCASYVAHNNSKRGHGFLGTKPLHPEAIITRGNSNWVLCSAV